MVLKSAYNKFANIVLNFYGDKANFFSIKKNEQKEQNFGHFFIECNELSFLHF